MAFVKKLGAVAAALTLAATLAACGSDSDDPIPTNAPTTAPGEETPGPITEPEAPTNPDSGSIQDYVALVNQQSEGMFTGFEDIYSDISILAEGNNTIEYRYTFVDYIDPAIGREGLEGQVSMLQSMADSMLFAEMERYGIVDPKVRYTYINSDGSELFTVLLER